MYTKYDVKGATETSGYLWRHYISCCTCGHLVYIRNLKCGSTFFWRNFLDTFKWWEIRWSDINWEKQRVFGHLMDPLQRRIKGMAEHLHMAGLDDLFRTNKKFRQFIVDIPVLDSHSASYFDWFGTAAWHIDWIPVGADNKDTVDHTETLLAHYRMYTLDRWNYAWSHPSEPNKKQTEQLLTSESNLKPLPEHVLWHFHNDLDLWNKVTQKFNPNGTGWDEISWLDQPTTVPYVR